MAVLIPMKGTMTGGHIRSFDHRSTRSGMFEKVSKPIRLFQRPDRHIRRQMIQCVYGGVGLMAANCESRIDFFCFGQRDGEYMKSMKIAGANSKASSHIRTSKEP